MPANRAMLRYAAVNTRKVYKKNEKMKRTLDNRESSLYIH
jgi:hypothetical protein